MVALHVASEDVHANRMRASWTGNTHGELSQRNYLRLIERKCKFHVSIKSSYFFLICLSCYVCFFLSVCEREKERERELCTFFSAYFYRDLISESFREKSQFNLVSLRECTRPYILYIKYDVHCYYNIWLRVVHSNYRKAKRRNIAIKCSLTRETFSPANLFACEFTRRTLWTFFPEKSRRLPPRKRKF